MNEALRALDTKEYGGSGAPLKIYNATQPFTEDEPAIKWDGEWHITIEVFRDLGSAFAAVLVLIFILMVGWFRSFLTGGRHGGDSILAGGHPAGAWAVGCLLHRHVDDRLHGRGGHRGAQLDHPRSEEHTS